MNMTSGVGVIFDMDGVLVDSRDAHLQSWMMLADEMNRELTETAFHGTFGRTSREAISILFGTHLPETEVKRLDERKEAIYRDIIRAAVPAMPGAVALVQALSAAGIRLAVGSSGPPENIDLVLTAMGIKQSFRAVVTGVDVERGKPDPQVFQLAAARLELPEASCVVIEDAPVGVESARRAGCPVVALVGSHAHDALTAADRIVEHLNAVTVELIRELIDTAR